MEWQVKSNVDYLTLVGRTIPGQLWLRQIWEKATSAIKEAGVDRIKTWRFKQYLGEGTPYVSYGTRDDGAILIARGEWAETLWDEQLSLEPNCTRIDLAVTVLLDSPNTQVARTAADELHAGIRRGKRRYYPVFTVNLGGGQTFYLGERDSSLLYRLYDKGTQAGTYPEGTLWRYELQYGKDSANRVYRALVEICRKGESAVELHVHDKFREIGVSPEFKPGTGRPLVMEKLVRLTSNERTLVWLSSSVAPAVQRLVAAGLEDEVRRILGFQPDLF